MRISVCLLVIVTQLHHSFGIAYQVLNVSATNLNWLDAREECETINMTLPSLTESDVIQLLQSDSRIINSSIWLDGRCGWNLNQPERSIAGMRLSYRLEINDRTGKENCLALHCKRPTSYCTVKDYYCDSVLPYFCPNLWVIGDASCPQQFNEYQRYKHMEPKFRSCYSKAKYTWSDAMKLNKCGGTSYTDFVAITEATNDYIYLNSTSKYYWFGAGRYSCETVDGDPLPAIERDSNVKHGHCYSYSITDFVNGTDMSYKITKRAIDCTDKPAALSLVCQQNQTDVATTIATVISSENNAACHFKGCNNGLVAFCIGMTALLLHSTV